MRMLPSGSCDTHVHLFGSSEKYPFAPERAYTPGDADESGLEALHGQLGIARVVLVQPSPYGTDNSRMVAGLRQLGAAARGIAVVDLATPGETLDRLHEEGVRGVRVNVATASMNDPEQAWQMIQSHARQVARLGWHVQVLARPAVIEALATRLLDLETRLVIDHFGLPDMALGPEQPGFASVLHLARSGNATIKISAIARLAGHGSLERAHPFIQALVDANPAALVWGSDWPHTGGGRGMRSRDGIEPFATVDDTAALASVMKAIPDIDRRKAVFVDNPAALYDFQDERVR